MDAGIIKTVKDSYLTYLAEHLFTENEVKSINVLDAITWITKSWTELKIDTVRNCCKHARFSFLCGIKVPNLVSLDDSESNSEIFEEDYLREDEEKRETIEIVMDFDNKLSWELIKKISKEFECLGDSLLHVNPYTYISLRELKIKFMTNVKISGNSDIRSYFLPNK